MRSTSIKSRYRGDCKKLTLREKIQALRPKLWSILEKPFSSVYAQVTSSHFFSFSFTLMLYSCSSFLRYLITTRSYTFFSPRPFGHKRPPARVLISYISTTSNVCFWNLAQMLSSLIENFPEIFVKKYYRCDYVFSLTNGIILPNKHTTSFWRPYNVQNVKTTSYGCQNEVVCVLGYYVASLLKILKCHIGVFFSLIELIP